MKVVFLQNIKGTAQVGDVKNVNDGYARNFLFPKNIAKPATPETLKQAEDLRKKREFNSSTQKEKALEMAENLENFVLDLTEDANDEGHLYGSINAKKIAKELEKAKVHIKEEAINLAEPIKTLGEHEVEIELHPEVKTKIKVNITSAK